MADQDRKREKFLFLPEAHNGCFIIGGAGQPEGPVSAPEPAPEPAPTPVPAPEGPVSTPEPMPEPAPTPVSEGPSGIYPCPCCGYLTLRAPKEAAIACICPVCFWENDVFDPGEDDPSDENGGMTLRQGRENFKQYGAVRPDLIRYARPPRSGEDPERSV